MTQSIVGINDWNAISLKRKLKIKHSLRKHISRQSKYAFIKMF